MLLQNSRLTSISLICTYPNLAAGVSGDDWRREEDLHDWRREEDAEYCSWQQDNLFCMRL